MKVFVSVDMEGVTGITDPEDVLPDGADYQRGRVLMTGDANAAVLGAFDAGATEVLVNDSHWTMRNLLLEQLDPRARMIRGVHKQMCMVQGLDESFDTAVFVGYHSCAGTEGGVLNHTLLGKEVQNLLLNGEPIGETRLNSLMAGHYGVSVCFVSGDTAVCQEAKSVLGQDLRTFAVKDGIDRFTASCLHPNVAQNGIRETVALALRERRREPYRMQPPYTFGFEWSSTSIASTCEYIPGVRKISPRATEFTTHDLPSAMQMIVAQVILALQVGQKGIYS
ncbi:MAG TPA: M55 family metallopeptidase [Candidatus Saccharimonadales bacterium]|nr:M55 family metallopeptidase [Candidatus Saccharimonadales bacterium]